MSDDLKYAKVYFSVIGDKSDVVRVQAGLDSAKGFIKKAVGRRVKLRYMPEIVFEHDPTLEMGDDLERLFQKIRRDDAEETNE
jgi:ribosome-binding factor A